MYAQHAGTSSSSTGINMNINNRPVTSQLNKTQSSSQQDTSLQQSGQWKKGKWTSQEDQLLRDTVQEIGPDGVKDWLLVAKRVPNRSHKQCRERWTNHLCPQIRKQQWTEEEKRTLVKSWRKFSFQRNITK
ncbi:MAG: hypothetical protein EZS28_050406 [Streblomastix strix]|uniref:Uncharacterized protein n=1 Tax=Streblomastix strix TaxID=222440 RepID=A0A5J4T738_9EUKA|nr:MAG: hypothetical protein EZS28_050406 [Streblomastix strix]